MDVQTFVVCLVLASACIFSCQSFVDAEKLKLCIVDGVHTAKKVHKTCQEFIKLESQIECVVGNDRYNCLRRLTTGNSDFTVLEPEDLIAATVYTEDNVLVTNELRLFPNEKQRFEVIALANKNVKGLSDLRGKRFCHPGYEATDDWTQIFATYFENRIIPKECDPNKTLVENRMSSLSTFFEAACIAGAWTPDSTLDSKLKSKYRNLCALCDNPAGCYSGDKYHGREGSLLCLTDNVGDVAWVRLDDARQHFKVQRIDKKNFNYLCPDGTTRPMDVTDPCVWMSKPWPVVAARIDVAERVSQMMRSLNVQKVPWQNSLLQLLENYHATPVSTYNLLTPEDFLRKFPGFISANSRANCQPSRRVRWCVASNLEDLKCRWLREASFVYGIEPSISCIQESNRVACLESVRSRRTDLFVTRPDEELEARKNGLEPILDAFTNKREDFNKVAAVVRTSAPFKYLKDLKGAKACFTGYRSIGWNAFESIMRDNLGMDRDCSDTSAIGNFFKDTYVFGLDKEKDNTPNNLHSLCEQGEDVEAEQSTFDCLASGRGDVAFVSINTVVRNTGSSGQRDGPLSSLNSTDFKYLCIDESNLEEDPCILTWTTLGSVMVHKSISDLRRDEIYSMFLEMDLLFGRAFKEQTAAFSLYGVYDANRSVIFPEQTQHLQRDPSHVRLVRNYRGIVDKLLKDPSCNSADRFTETTMCFLCTAIILNQFYRWVSQFYETF